MRLDWRESADGVWRSVREVSGYGLLVLFVRADGVVTAMVIPKAPGHEPEVIRQKKDVSIEDGKEFLQMFMDRLAGFFPASVQDGLELPGFVVLDGGGKIMCLKCGSISSSEKDVRERYCGRCKEFLQ